VFVLVFLPFALGTLSSLMRTVNATLAPQLVAALALTPGQLGLLTSASSWLRAGAAAGRHGAGPLGPARVQLPMLLLAGVARWRLPAARIQRSCWWRAR
jgi:hypothetical protein